MIQIQNDEIADYKIKYDELKKKVTMFNAERNFKILSKCIQIGKEILGEEPILDYCPPFLDGLKLDGGDILHSTNHSS